MSTGRILIIPIAAEALSQRPQHLAADQSGLGSPTFHLCLATLLQISREESEEDMACKRPTGKPLFLFLNSLVRDLVGCISAEGSSTVFYLSQQSSYLTLWIYIEALRLYGVGQACFTSFPYPWMKTSSWNYLNQWQREAQIQTHSAQILHWPQIPQLIYVILKGCW